MRIGILTSGGDAPGMNAAVANIVIEAMNFGDEIFAFEGGFKGLVENTFKKLNYEDVKNISHLGGSVLKSSRYLQFLEKKYQEQAVKNIRDNNIDCLIAIGGNGTFNGLKELIALGINCFGIPATIDNDLFYLDKTLGFDTAVNTVVEAVDKIRETMECMSRGCIIEVMGRHCGDIGLYSGIASGADEILVPEKKFTIEDTIIKLKKVLLLGKSSPIVIVSEHLIDINEWANAFENALNIEFKANSLGYLQRGGRPTVFDRMLAKQLGVSAVRFAHENHFNLALGTINNTVVPVSFQVALSAISDFNFSMLKLV